jgi:hypothetical protein
MRGFKLLLTSGNQRKPEEKQSLNKITFVNIIQAAWPIFAGLVVALIWLMSQINSKVSKTECSMCRQDNKEDLLRVDSFIKEMRMEFRNSIDNLTALIVGYFNNDGK